MSEGSPTILTDLSAATALTLVGLAFGVAAAAAGFLGEPELAMVGLAVAGLCDLFDGLLARALDLDQRQQAFGVQIDSLVDMASFGVAPGLVVVALAGGPLRPVALAAALTYAACAALRLAHFNLTGVTRSEAGAYYQGLPVTYAALVLPVAYVATTLAEPAWAAAVELAALAICAGLFVLRVPIRKPGGPMYAVFPLLALVVVGTLLTWRLSS